MNKRGADDISTLLDVFTWSAPRTKYHPVMSAIKSASDVGSNVDTVYEVLVEIGILHLCDFYLSVSLE